MSVPRPWPRRRPIMGLMLAGFAWLAAVLNLVGALVGPPSESDTFEWVLFAAWAVIGAVWFWQWRRAVRAYGRLP